MCACADPETTYHPRFQGSFVNCPLEYDCSADWFELTATDSPDVRQCASCGKEVRFCTTFSQMYAQSKLGRCVAFYEARPQVKTQQAHGLSLSTPGYRIQDGIVIPRSNRGWKFIEGL